jgi:hypothetical protein
MFAPDAVTTTFSVNDIRCWQSRLIRDNSVHFRWLLDTRADHPPTQCDFHFIADTSADMGRTVESFLGSLYKINTNKPKEYE